METINRINNNLSWFELYIEDDEARPAGLYCITDKYNPVTKQQEQEVKYISTPIRITQKVTSESGNFYKVVFFDDKDRKEKYIQAKDLFLTSTKNSPDFDYLTNNGLIIEEKCRSLVLEYLKNCAKNVDDIKQGTEYSGWTDDGEYITNGFNTTGDEMIFTGSTMSTFRKGGSAEEQKSFLGNLFTSNPLAFFIMSYCYGGFLAKHLNEDSNQILALVGQSSMGKSTIGKICMSGYTDPRNFGSMNATAKAIQSILKQHNDSFIFFDETGETTVKKEDRLQMLYALANGKERSILKKFGDTYQANVQGMYKYSLLVAGEESLIKNLQATEGIKVRLNEIVLGENVVIFEGVNSSSQIEEINQHILKHYGHIAPEFIEMVRRDKDTLAFKYRETLDNIRNNLELESQLANRKAKILALSEISARYLGKIIFNDEDVINELVYDMYRIASTCIFASVDIKEEVTDIFKDHLSHFESQQQQYFLLFDGDNQLDQLPIKEVWGEVRNYSTHKEIIVVNNCFLKLCERLEVDDKVFINYLLDNNLLQTTKDGRKQVSVTRNGQSKKYYKMRIPHKFFEEKPKEVKQEQFELGDEGPVFSPLTN